jgi:hypothetical protein
LLDLSSIYVISPLLHSNSVIPAHRSSHDNSWQEESSWHPNAIGDDGKDVPTDAKDEQINLFNLKRGIIIEKRLDCFTLGVQEE